MAIYTGALQPKKKSELQELATELGLDIAGTKDDIAERIKTHLADNQILAQDERFAGLYGRRKKTFKESSQQPEASPVPEDEHTGGVMTRRSMAKQIFPTSPVKEKVSEAVDAVASPVSNAISHPPSSPVRSMIAAFNKAVAAAPEAEVVKEAIEVKRRQLYVEGNKAVDGARTYLSNAKNISSLTILIELGFVLYTFIPWAFYDVPLNAPYKLQSDGSDSIDGQAVVSTRIAHIPYPPAWFLGSSFFYTTLLNWAIPTIFIPQLIATLVSFRPNIDWSKSQESDALTAAIIRVACVLAGEWGLNWNAVGVTGKWRLLGASVAAAFAFAEAIGERKAVSAPVPAIEAEDEDSQAVVPHKPSRL